MDDEYKKLVAAAVERLKAAGVNPCEKHGWTSMNLDNSCEACKKEDFPEDWLGVE